MPVTITGVSSVSDPTIFGGTTVTWKSGTALDPTKDENVAVIGTKIADKKSLKVGSTFTAYNMTITVTGIYDAGTDFANNGVFTSLIALQRLSGQSGAITSATVTVDSLDNLLSTSSAIKAVLGDAADVTSSQEAADTLVAPLKSVSNIALFSLIGAAIAGAIIILLTMLMIVRERRREIGVMKAIGSSNIGIVSQFIIEALTLTVLGLAVGLGIGVAAATPLTNSLVTSTISSSQQSSSGRQGGFGGGMRGLRTMGNTSRQTIRNVTTSVSASTLAFGILAALGVAVVGSAVPAYFISKIKPAEAMRNE